MNRKDYESDICRLYKNFVAMSETKKSEVVAEDETDSLITDSERKVLLSRISGQLGISDAKVLPYVSGLTR